MHELTVGEYDFSADGAGRFACDLAARVVPDTDYEASGAVGERAGRILAAIRNENCDHVFLLGRRRTSTGKAVFGDAIKRVLLDTSVPVTTNLRD
jgi:nucleotide-binding universal stress UspA family protein